MKKYAVAGSLAALCLLCACAQTAQGKLRQAVYDTASAYHLLASPMPDVMAGHVPGVSLSAAQKALARKASQSVLDELSALELSIQNGNTLAETAVAALQADFAAFSTCWTGLAAGSTPVACTPTATSATSTVQAGASATAAPLAATPLSTTGSN